MLHISCFPACRCGMRAWTVAAVRRHLVVAARQWAQRERFRATAGEVKKQIHTHVYFTCNQAGPQADSRQQLVHMGGCSCWPPQRPRRWQQCLRRHRSFSHAQCRPPVYRQKIQLHDQQVAPPARALQPGAAHQLQVAADEQHALQAFWQGPILQSNMPV
jgi:hypothetical protein